ncbi:MAG TPA: penicillin-binding protein 2 [Gaiellaceae bacterium]
MNRQVSRLALAALFLMIALIGATTYWQTWAQAGLADRQDNEIQRVARFTIKRGLIYAGDGKTVLAANRPKRVGNQTLYLRRYPQGKLAPHVIGYSTETRSQAGIERSFDDYLTGSNANLNTVLKTALDRLRGVTVKGNNVYLSIDPQAQRLANEALAGKCGAAVAIEPSTGKVLVLASSPSYNENLVEKSFGLIRRISAPCRPPSPLLDRATQGLYQPGSTFKVVTAAAALDTGRFTPDSSFYDPGYCTEYGRRISNAGNPETGPEQFGQVNFTTALQHSINAVFCNIGKAIGAGTILDYAKRFGFYSRPPLETPINERSASGLYKRGKPFLPSNPATQVDPGRLAFGQERLLVTPLQMAMVAAAVANHGVVMRPYVVEKIVSPGGSTVQRTHPDKLDRAIKPQTAGELTAMMEAVVTGGTGTAAQIPGVPVAGKTGTAETGVANVYTAWFISFAPANKPKVAVAVVVENGGFGGKSAAPIAKTLMQAILRRP